jgi:hypothetical protein
MTTRRKCFISYHHEDQAYVDSFIRTFDDHHDAFIARQLGQMPDDIINSTNTDYVMQRIRTDYIKDSTVTIVMMGKCTWARRYVDWEIQASLRSGDTITPNGLLGIKLPTFTQFPERFNANANLSSSGRDDNYAGWIDYPRDAQTLWNAIEWAYNRRSTHKRYIVNQRDRFGYNKTCN